MRADRQRLDKWLVFARFAKNRAAALRLIEDGHVRVEGRRSEDGAQALKVGDVLTLALAHATLVVRLVGLGERRGPYDEARRLYEALTPGGGASPPASPAGG